MNLTALLEQVDEDLAQARTVADAPLGHAVVDPAHELEALVVGAASASIVHAPSTSSRTSKTSPVELELAGLDLREVQDVLDDAPAARRPMRGPRRAYSRCSPSRSVSSSRPVMPITPFIGVRISWLMFATNSDFSRDASTAALLRGRQRVLRALAGGDVVRLGDEVQRAPFGVADERHADRCPDPVAVGVDVALLAGVVVALAGQQRRQRLRRSVVGVRDLHVRQPEQLLAGAPDHRAERVVDAQVEPVEVHDHHADERVVERATKLLLGRLHAGLLAPALGDVAHGGGHEEAVRVCTALSVIATAISCPSLWRACMSRSMLIVRASGAATLAASRAAMPAWTAWGTSAR